ncbi:ribosomal RNA processing protein 1 homolog A [Nematolebias whitei]|uniref:ribosomal RNA processing protein 1 homolog A n=1 Tax=Nematolebias whitei TaxID=451745 RepID=UPI001899F2AC|nr:ribosomal RNA processing protein 1 homolog A [Nematolebias whitei]
MASVLEPEAFLAQRLASNEKTVRTRTIKKLRKYISVRSLKASGGFSADELLKLWKGLFYCLWMQDKPLLQEEISNHISSFIHNFQGFDKQLMYLGSFLQTLKREWTGIDRLRMDKFYQLVRFMFRQTFEVLKRMDWDNSMVEKFLQLLTSDLLQSDSKAPAGLQFHILNLYLTELAAVGSAQLTANQNLTFIEPFCKTAAKTKNRLLFSAICSNIFTTIIDQAPFAVQDLMKELKASDSYSGQASEEEEEEEEENRSEEDETRTVCRKSAGKQINGRKRSKDDDDYDEEEEPFQLEDSDIGPVLQFDYSAVADKLLELAGRSSTLGHNRQKLYKIIKVLRDLSQGIFPQDEEEEVSTDEDDDMFCSRKRMKRAIRRDDDEEEMLEGKKRNKAEPGRKKEELSKQNQNTDFVDGSVRNEKKKTKDGNRQSSEQPERAQFLEPEVTGGGRQSESPLSRRRNRSKKKKQRRKNDFSAGVAGLEEEQHTSTSAETSSEASVQMTKKKKKKDLKAESDSQIPQVTHETPASPEVSDKNPAKNKKKSQKAKVKLVSVNNMSSSTEFSSKGSAEDPNSGLQETSQGATHIKKGHKAEKVRADTGKLKAGSAQDKTSEHNTAGRRRKKSKQKVKLIPEEESAQMQNELADADNPAPTPPKKKKSRKGSAEEEEKQSLVDGPTGPQTPTKKKKKTTAGQVDATECPSQDSDAGKPAKKRKIPVEFEFEADELEGMATPSSSRPKAKRGRKRLTPIPMSESKNVTFGLKNNKTAEFKKTDRSLLLSPDGSSRVPFDPQQKPKFGVLKSPTIPSSTKKTRCSTPWNKAKRRPMAADFF